MNQTNATRVDEARPALMPPVDVFEDGAGITLLADLPGVPREKLNIHVEADTLTIEAEMDLAAAPGMEVNHAEVGLARYRRVFNLSKELDATQVAAELKNGVLSLRIPKTAHAQPRRIEIRVD